LWSFVSPPPPSVEQADGIVAEAFRAGHAAAEQVVSEEAGDSGSGGLLLLGVSARFEHLPGDDSGESGTTSDARTTPMPLSLGGERANRAAPPKTAKNVTMRISKARSLSITFHLPSINLRFPSFRGSGSASRG
jgi:hypothetical protein